MEQLTPELLAQYLDVMRKAGLMTAHLKTPQGEVAVTFGPDSAPLPGDSPTPGGWKGPDRLDADFDPREEPRL